ncbi:hypothetical protein B0H19DRAFT_1269070 [Mycena capillaripes]|nr:hypothetical protein B0H19DRAFT_1269070 [Mycena capillaripes]
MIFDSHHHHQNTPTAAPAPIASSAGGFGLSSTTDQLAAHYRHLESLLDSSLATLTLINATQCTSHLPPFTVHTVQVTQALNHLITANSYAPTLTTCTPPRPDHTHAPTPAATPKPEAATYAMIADPHRSPSPTTPNHDTLK